MKANIRLSSVYIGTTHCLSGCKIQVIFTKQFTYLQEHYIGGNSELIILMHIYLYHRTLAYVIWINWPYIFILTEYPG